MAPSFSRFGGMSAILVGALSILYAIFFLVLAKQPGSEFLGTFGSWVILAASGLFSSAAYVALYQRIKGANDDGFALWAVLLGVMSSFATILHGVYQALLVSALRDATPATKAIIDAARELPSQVDPAGVAAFGIVGVVAFLFGRLIVQGGTLPKNLGYLGMFNALLLVVLFFATAGGSMPIILLSGGLTSVIVGPIWWVWVGRQLMR